MQSLAIAFAIVGLSMIFMLVSFRLRVNEDESTKLFQSQEEEQTEEY